MNLNEAIINIRVELQEANLKKSGQNKHAGFAYYELSDFLPSLNHLMLKYGVNDQVSISDGDAKLILRKDNDVQTYNMPFVMFDTPITKNGSQMMQPIQYLGAINTYYKRYLYLNAFGITDGEVIDSLDNSQLVTKTYKTASKQTPQDKQEYWNEFTVMCRSLDIDAIEFLTEWAEVDMEDKFKVGNTISQYLKDKDQFQEQLVNYKESKK